MPHNIKCDSRDIQFNYHQIRFIGKKSGEREQRNKKKYKNTFLVEITMFKGSLKKTNNRLQIYDVAGVVLN